MSDTVAELPEAQGNLRCVIRERIPVDTVLVRELVTLLLRVVQRQAHAVALALGILLAQEGTVQRLFIFNTMKYHVGIHNYYFASSSELMKMYR